MVKAQCSEWGGAQTLEGHKAQQLCWLMNIQSTNPQNWSCSYSLGYLLLLCPPLLKRPHLTMSLVFHLILEKIIFLGFKCICNPFHSFDNSFLTFTFHTSTTSFAKCLLLTLNIYYEPIHPVRRLKHPTIPRHLTCPLPLTVLRRWCGSARNLSRDCQAISALTRYFSLAYCGLVTPSSLNEEQNLQGS